MVEIRRENEWVLTDVVLKHIYNGHGTLDIDLLFKVLLSEKEEYIDYTEVLKKNIKLKAKGGIAGGNRCTSLICYNKKIFTVAFEEKNGVKYIVTFYESNSFSRKHKFIDRFFDTVETISELLDCSDKITCIKKNVKCNKKYLIDLDAEQLGGIII